MARQNPGLGSKTGHYQQIFSVTETQLTNDEIVSVIETQTTAKKELIIGELTETISLGVVSFNGLTGAVSFTQYVSAVGGATGAVASVDGGSFT